jgi:hypothetical protein
MVVRRQIALFQAGWAQPLNKTALLRLTFWLAVTIASAIGLSTSEVIAAEGAQAPAPKSESTESLPEAKESHLGDTNLLANPSLEEKDETGRPRGWAVSPSNIIVPAPPQEATARNGRHTLMLRSVKETWGVVAQEIKLDAKDTGKTLFVSAQGRAPLSDHMFLSVEYTIKGKINEIKAPFPASPDSWKAVSLTLDLPKDVQPDKLRVRVIIRNDPGYVFRVDDLFASLM